MALRRGVGAMQVAQRGRWGLQARQATARTRADARQKAAEALPPDVVREAPDVAAPEVRPRLVVDLHACGQQAGREPFADEEEVVLVAEGAVGALLLAGGEAGVGGDGVLRRGGGRARGRGRGAR